MNPVFKSIQTKANTLSEVGIEPYLEGKSNYDKNLLCVEELAKERLEICKGCEHFKKEPIPMLRIKDKRIKELSSMMCNDCGCSSPYKLRQSIEKCKKWNK